MNDIRRLGKFLSGFRGTNSQEKYYWTHFGRLIIQIYMLNSRSDLTYAIELDVYCVNIFFLNENQV